MPPCLELTCAFRLGLLQEPNLKFKTIIIDETCYQPQSETLTALSPFLHPQGQNPRVILSGDPFQLSYTPRSKAAKKANFVSLADRLKEVTCEDTSDLAQSLSQCQADIGEACEPDNFPAVPADRNMKHQSQE